MNLSLMLSICTSWSAAFFQKSKCYIDIKAFYFSSYTLTLNWPACCIAFSISGMHFRAPRVTLRYLYRFFEEPVVLFYVHD